MNWGNVREIIEQKMLKTAEKVVRPALGCAQHSKAGRTTQQLWIQIPTGTKVLTIDISGWKLSQMRILHFVKGKG